METTFFLFTWPDSQIFIGIEDAILVLPPENDIKGTLDSACLVPPELVEKVAKMTEDKDSLYYGLTMPLPEGKYVLSNKFKGDNCLQDYFGHNYEPVKE